MLAQARSEHRDDGEREEHEGKGEHHVDDVMIVQSMPPAEVARGEAEQHADGGRQQARRTPPRRARRGRRRSCATAGRGPPGRCRAGARACPPSIQAGGASRWRMFTASGSWGAIQGASARGDDEQEEPAPRPGPSGAGGAAGARPGARPARLGGASSRSPSATSVGALTALHAPARMRGSMKPTTRSTMRFTATMTRASRITAHCTTGKSWLRMDSTVRVATPGHANTVSVMMAPPRSWPNCRPEHRDHGDAGVAERVLHHDRSARPRPWRAPS